MTSKRRILIAVLLILVIIAGGTAGYMLLEEYSFVEALFMSAITMSTVGYGEVRTLSETGRVFSICLIFSSFVGLAFAGHALGESLLEKVWSGRSEIKKMKKKISELRGHYIVCGFGRVGRAAVDHFVKTGVSFVIIESDPGHIADIKRMEYLFVEGDATRETVLMEAGIKRARGLLALVGSDPDNLFLVLTARELNPTLSIISRANDASAEKKIIRAGADSTISPFASAGRQVANDILAVTGQRIAIADVAALKDVAPRWITVQEGSSMAGVNIGDLSRQMGRKILGLRREGEDRIFPEDTMILRPGDMLLVMDEEKDGVDASASPAESGPKKVVIVDDNPVIVKLYTRLFQKAGFIPLAATDGRQGLDLILKEKPAAAVIDYMLPLLSGIEICRLVRDAGSCEETRLILFTADEQKETRQRALRAGADAVVVKSPEAGEVIETVLGILKDKRRAA
ncbi:MAG: NAD-binding protein [Deltaproteobacteria bacterium]|nr:NAD-binding protein [Deltaproteobacteria bacterium]MBW1950061.1 NAD-binding protein [Deltaproteobacteria bacterium]MBW2008505.1 NAD-binding protein [Deltaproteobacteria bacterium]MBW2102011.1 NAD-binding protein [Deltaproteobacteria bacterium]